MRYIVDDLQMTAVGAEEHVYVMGSKGNLGSLVSCFMRVLLCFVLPDMTSIRNICVKF